MSLTSIFFDDNDQSVQGCAFVLLQSTLHSKTTITVLFSFSYEHIYKELFQTISTLGDSFSRICNNWQIRLKWAFFLLKLLIQEQQTKICRTWARYDACCMTISKHVHVSGQIQREYTYDSYDQTSLRYRLFPILASQL